MKPKPIDREQREGEAAFDEGTMDLVQLRKAKRLFNRGLRELEAIERHILKFRRAERERQAEIAAAPPPVMPAAQPTRRRRTRKPQPTPEA